MKLTRLTLSNFQSFGPKPTALDLQGITFLIGPNGSGKTAVLQALARMFAFDRSLRRIRQSDFHVAQHTSGETPSVRDLWLEAQFEFPELKDDAGRYPTIPGHFAHLQLESADGVPRIRLRLEAQLDEDGEIEEHLWYVVQVDEHYAPVKKVPASRHDRNQIQVHYLPARRDPTDHISYATNSLMGRALRAVNWQPEREEISGLSDAINNALSGNAAIIDIDKKLAESWKALHKGAWFADPGMKFGHSEFENLLRYLTVGFAPGPYGAAVDFTRLSDGQKSLLFLTVVLALQRIGREVLAGKLVAFDVDRLKPPVFTMIAMEEPENSLSPHYVGRVVQALSAVGEANDAQAIIATHAPSLLKRIAPESIRYLRLGSDRITTVRRVVLPEAADDAYRFVREAVQAFPELYFSRAVILGEGDSEEIVVTRLLEASGVGTDDSSISVVPLGGRHVHHFWRLLRALEIPYVTLLDLDLARYQGGWGRLRYAIQQLLKFPSIKSDLSAKHLDDFPEWSNEKSPLETENGKGWIKFLERSGVFFATPLDMDFLMLRAFPKEYGATAESLQAPDPQVIVAVLGKSHADPKVYTEEEQTYFERYHRLFKLGSKPTAHLSALSALENFDLDLATPPVLSRLIEQVKAKLAELPE